MSNFVTHRALQIQRRTGRALVQPSEKVAAWLEFLEQSFLRHANRQDVIQRIKEYYHNLYLTRPSEVPESFFQTQIRAAREQGYGHLKMNKKMKDELVRIAIEDQKRSLDDWLDYFLSDDSSIYPMWIKYWSFHGMIKLGKFDPEKGVFSNRSKGQMLPFPDLNREAFALVVDVLMKKVGGQSLDAISDPALIRMLEGANFGKLYGRMLLLTTRKQENFATVEGRWITYKQNDNPNALVESLKGRSSGWCTAGYATAKKQLADGDFHVFYSFDENGEPKIPRLAIRMSGPSIAEIRGVGKDQNIDPEMGQSGVLEKKLAEMGESSEVYFTKTAHMKKLSQIELKQLANEELTVDELRFLYEVDSDILGFGQKRDPRIEEIKKMRSIKRDIARIFQLNYSDSEISISLAEAFNKGIKFHFGDLHIYESDVAKKLTFPPTVIGDISITSLKSAIGLKLPKNLIGNLSLPGLKSPEGLVLPQNFRGHLKLFNLRTANGLKFPHIFFGDISMSNLESTEGLILPKKLYGSLNLGLKFAKDLVLPELIEGHLFLTSLQSAQHLVLSEKIKGDVYLSLLSSLDGIVLPREFNGRYFLNGQN